MLVTNLRFCRWQQAQRVTDKGPGARPDADRPVSATTNRATQGRHTLGMSMPEPGPFADEWISAWNARDVEAVLAHYADDVVFTSPTALRVVPASGGIVRDKDALRSYWRPALQGITPSL